MFLSVDSTAFPRPRLAHCHGSQVVPDPPLASHTLLPRSIIGEHAQRDKRVGVVLSAQPDSRCGTVADLVRDDVPVDGLSDGYGAVAVLVEMTGVCGFAMGIDQILFFD